MLAPSVRYTHSDDGVAIAYAEAGNGPTLLVSTGIMMPLNAGWEEGALWNRLARSFRVVRFDPRGCGLSERRNVVGSFTDEAADIISVVNAINEPRVSLMGLFIGSPGALLGAIANPERFSHLILHDPIPVGIRRPLPIQDDKEIYLVDDVVEGLLQMGWKYDRAEARQALFTLMMPEASSEALRTIAEQVHRYPNVERLTNLIAEKRELDYADALATLELPTLISLSQLREGGEVAHMWADAIPGAQLTVPNHPLSVMVAGTPAIEELGASIEQFLRPQRNDAAASRETTRTMLFTDIEGSTDMVDRLGDDASRAITREVEALTRSALRAHDGHEVKTMGDGFFAWFNLASAALDTAIDLQREIIKRFGAGAGALRVRIGINAGEPIEEANDIYGGTVNRAARIMSLAAGGEILVSHLVRGLVQGRSYRFDDRGVHMLRGIEEPQHLFALRWRSEPHSNGAD